MKESRSFTEYVKNFLDNQLWKALEDYLETADPSELDLQLSKVRNPGQLELYDTDLQFINVTDLPGTMIAFTVVTDATLIIHDIDQYHNDETDCDHQWFTLKCTGDLDKQLNDMTVNAITVYSGHERRHRRLSDSLVPVMRKENLEQVADEFLKKYYPEARLQPMWVNPVKIAKRMGLTVICYTISSEGTVFGQIYFREAEATLYDEKTEQTIKQKVSPGTIIVDPNVAFQRNLGAYNNTIVHECVHWEYHKKAFALELVHLTIYKNFSNTAPLRTEANRARFLCSLKEIYNFFDISCEGDTDYSWLKAFYAQFNQYTPNHYFPSDEHLKQRQITVISALDPSDDPDKIYPFVIRRNSESQHRSSFNDQKAKLACPKLYKDILKNDHSLSLCFSKNPADEKDEQTIRHNFIENSR